MLNNTNYTTASKLKEWEAWFKSKCRVKSLKNPIKTNKIFNTNQNSNDIVNYYVRATFNINERFYGGFIAVIAPILYKTG